MTSPTPYPDALEPRLDIGAEYLSQNPPPGRTLVCALSGAHMYGFPSADSDLDLKGIFAAPTESLLGLTPPRQVFDRTDIYKGVECDVTLMEVGKALTLVLAGNGNVAEQLCSPYQLVDGEALAELRELLRGALSKRFHRHYAGFFRGKQREHRSSETPVAKTLLYSMRVVLSGIHLMERGEIQADLRVLAPEHGVPELLDLIAAKQAGDEKGALSFADDDRFMALWPRLETKLGAALVASQLPDEPTNEGAISDWLVRFRLAQL